MQHNWKVIIADDEPEVHAVTMLSLKHLVFRGRGVNLLSAYTGKEVIQLVKDHPDSALIILDVIMEEDDTGLKTIKEIRDVLDNQLVRIILRTGQPGVYPESQVITDYDIDNYLEKGDLTKQKLVTSVISSIRCYENLLKLRRLNEDLESVVYSRTRELSEKTKQLQELMISLENRVVREIKNRLEKERLLVQHSKFALMGEMLSMIAHQWRQPLATVATLVVDLKVRLALDPDNRDGFNTTLNDIEHNVQFLSRTIDDFKSFYKPSRYVEKVNLKDVIDQAVFLIEKTITSEGIRLEKDYTFTAPVITFGGELIQVLLNILKNACEVLSDRNVPDALIRIYGYEKGAEKIIEIIDNGGGIRDDVMDKIFEPYYSTKGDVSGSGLGLYMSRMIVERHCKGELIACNLNGGACFTIKLPDSGVSESGN